MPSVACIRLDQQADIYSTRPLEQFSTGRHVDPFGHLIIRTPNLNYWVISFHACSLIECVVDRKQILIIL